MKKFSFRLQSLLNHRETVEETHRLALARLLRQAADQRHAIEQRTAALRQERRATAERLAAGLPAREIRLQQERTASLDQEIAHLQTELQRLEEQVEEARQQLITASQERRVVERLREKALEEHRYELRKEEDGLADESALVRRAGPSKK